jgi:pilus assembly protein Flp/PilA
MFSPQESEEIEMSKIVSFSRSLMKDDEGLALVEYTILLALIASAVIATIVLVGDKISTAWTNFNTNLTI